MSFSAKQEIKWWIENLESHNGRPIKLPSIEKTVYTDASIVSWAACCDSCLAHGIWDSDDAIMHINFLELKAVWLALQKFCDNDCNIHVAMKTDNSTAVAYINNFGGIHSDCLNNLSRDVWFWCIGRGIYLSAFHIPGKSNIQADLFSRICNNRTGWSLKDEIFISVKDTFNLEINIFASRFNKKLDCFVSWGPDPLAFAVNDFSFNWTLLDYNIYAFPPLLLFTESWKRSGKNRYVFY